MNDINHLQINEVVFPKLFYFAKFQTHRKIEKEKSTRNTHAPFFFLRSVDCTSANDLVFIFDVILELRKMLHLKEDA